MITKKNLADGFAAFQEPWSPRVAGDINDMQIKLVKLGCARSRRKIGETTHRSGLPATYRGGRFEPAVESAARLDMCAPACEVYLHEMPGGQ